ncbi:MAG: hypothetical protein GKR90_13660 [Pseudomonadales bacterium]|nr:hypothetical protein [Pseudomonadales bacterium]
MHRLLILCVPVVLLGCGSETISFDLKFTGMYFAAQPDPGNNHTPISVIHVTPDDIPVGSTPQTVATYWTTPTGSFRMGWETVIREPLADGNRLGISNVGMGSTTDEIDYDAPAPGTKQASINARGIIQPITDMFLVYDENLLKRDLYEDGFHTLEEIMQTSLVQCSGGPTNEYNQVVTLSSSCSNQALTSAYCSGASGISHLPWTSTGCSFRVSQDVDQVMDVILPTGDSAETAVTGTPSGYFRPTIKPKIRIIDGPRSLIRPLNFDSQRCLMRTPDGGESGCDTAHLSALEQGRDCRGFTTAPPQRGRWCGHGSLPLGGTPYPGLSEDIDFSYVRSTWKYTVEDANGNLEEEFSPRVRVNWVRIFATHPENDPPSPGEIAPLSPAFPTIEDRRYFSAEELSELVVEGFEYCVLETQPGTNIGRFNLQDCVKSSGNHFQALATPARIDGSLTVWSVRFQVDATADASIPTGYVGPEPTCLETDIGTLCNQPDIPTGEEVFQVGDHVLSRDVPVNARDRLWIEFEMSPS